MNLFELRSYVYRIIAKKMILCKTGFHFHEVLSDRKRDVCVAINK